MKSIDMLDIDSIPNHSKKIFKLKMVKNALGEFWQVPVMIAKGSPGKTLGITAALHGNELNGIPIIHSLWDSIDESTLVGTLVAIPVLNAPGFIYGTREFYDGKDLNRIMPGKKSGTTSEVYAHAIVEKILKHFDYHVDLHTASFGRINSLYVRADISNAEVENMAFLQEPQIIVNVEGEEGSLRDEAHKRKIPSITIEVGDPSVFQRQHIRPSIFGLNNVMIELGMIDEPKEEIAHNAVICKRSYWLYAETGGILQVFPELTDLVKKDDHIATIRDVYGNTITNILASEDAIVVAKATNPVCQHGSRIIHLGLVWDNYKKQSV